MAFDLTVIVMTLARTIQINRNCEGGTTLSNLLIRDGEDIPRNCLGDTELIA